MPAGISNAASPQAELYPLKGKTYLFIYGYQSGSGTQLLRNPTAGKIFYLMTVGMASHATADAARPSIFDDTDNLLLEGYHNVTATYKTSSQLNISTVFPIPIPIVRSTDGIRIIGAANCDTRGWISGWEE